jgi:hypothetical protein
MTNEQVKKLAAFDGTRRFINTFPRQRNYLRPQECCPQSHPLSFRPILILFPSDPSSVKWVLLYRFAYPNRAALLMHAACQDCLIVLHLKTLIQSGEKYKLWGCSLHSNFGQPPVAFCFIEPNDLLSSTFKHRHSTFPPKLCMHSYTFHTRYMPWTSHPLLLRLFNYIWRIVCIP